MSLDKKQRSTLGGAALFAALGLLEFFSARHAQMNHTVILHKGSWYTPEVGYLIAFCLVALSAVLLIAARRRSHDEKP